MIPEHAGFCEECPGPRLAGRRQYAWVRKAPWRARAPSSFSPNCPAFEALPRK